MLSKEQEAAARHATLVLYTLHTVFDREHYGDLRDAVYEVVYLLWKLEDDDDSA